MGAPLTGQRLFIRNGEFPGARRAEPVCPTCGEAVGGYTHLAGDPNRQYEPKAGDVAVCAYCSGVSVLQLGAKGWTLRAATGEERAQGRGPLSLDQMVKLTQDYRRSRQQ